MNFKKLFFLLAVLAIGFASCNDDNDNEPKIIMGTWQYASLEKAVIETDHDSLSAAIGYQEIKMREDSIIMDFKRDSTMCLSYKDGITSNCNNKYLFDGKTSLTIFTTKDTINYKFEIIERIALYRTGAIDNYKNKDGTVNKDAFYQLAALYPKTLEGVKPDGLKIKNIYFIELFKRLDMYYKD